MKRKVKELMKAVSNFAVVDESSTLFEAILAMGALSSQDTSCGLKCPAALVSNGNSEITGFLDFRNMLKGLEPKYAEIADSVEEGSISPDWIKTVLKKHGLWANLLDEICKAAGEIVIRDLKITPGEGQMIGAEASLNEALFQMMVTGKDYLFVKDGKKLAGIINLSDIARHMCDTVKACRI